ncbi:MAG: nuclear transport factor 2 family protein [Sporocytophaga sp.]|uniref:nuclear transport factor 2 family protein n=1 Tax=Sporocytophaga sp. TaxID=2231183 RepID=UPI001B0FFB18|nr:nuclear transport factor 2 family protein [Sporocytophaga sp.]MBO9702223.1 nuclear transport factor 2 family protein [Sporocytophaga sp.]
MEKIEIVKNLFTAIEKCDYTKAKSFLAPDFKILGAPPQPMGSDEWLAFHKQLSTGIPDFKFNMTDITESGNVVNGTAKVGGTFTKEMPSFIKGQPAIQPTNKVISNPKENLTMTFKGDKIVTITVEKVAGGGIPGFLKQIGAEVPSKV